MREYGKSVLFLILCSKSKAIYLKRVHKVLDSCFSFYSKRMLLLNIFLNMKIFCLVFPNEVMIDGMKK